MNDFLTKITMFIDAASTRGADAADLLGDALHSLADFLRQIGPGNQPVFGAAPDEGAKLDECLDKCRGAVTAAQSHVGGQVGAIGPGWLFVLQIVLAILEKLKQQQTP